MKRTVQTSRFGNIEVQSQHIIHFKDGMVGFIHLKDYFIIESPSMPLLLWLQSIDDPQVAFPIVEPVFFQRDYCVKASDADKSRLELGDSEITKQFVIMTVPQEMTQMTVNMKAPILLNLEKGLGTQVILQDKNLLVRKPAHEAFSKAMASFSDEYDDELSEEESEEWCPVDFRNVLLHQGTRV